MDWNFCKTFLAVAETGSFVAAARRLRSSHQTVARQIAALEAELGARLLARASDGLALTAQGRNFKEHADAMERAALRAEAAASTGGTSPRGVVKLSVGPTLAGYWLMPHMSEFRRSHPHIELDFITHPYPVSVRRREADVLLLVGQPGSENLVGRKIGRVGVGFYASSGYAAKHGLPRNRADWADHHIVAFADDRSNAEFGRWSDRITRSATVVMRCSSNADMLQAVRSGLGICALASLVGDVHSDLVRVGPGKLAGSSDAWLLAHPDLANLPTVRAVLDFVTSCARQDRELLRGSG